MTWDREFLASAEVFIKTSPNETSLPLRHCRHVELAQQRAARRPSARDGRPHALHGAGRGRRAQPGPIPRRWPTGRRARLCHWVSVRRPTDQMAKFIAVLLPIQYTIKCKDNMEPFGNKDLHLLTLRFRGLKSQLRMLSLPS